MDLIILLYSESRISEMSVTTAMGLTERARANHLNPKSLAAGFHWFNNGNTGKIRLVFGATALSAIGQLDGRTKAYVSMGDFNHPSSIASVTEYASRHINKLVITLEQS